MQNNKKFQAFKKKNENYTDADFKMESLYALWKIQAATEKTRANTSTLVWIVVVLLGLSVISTFTSSYFGRYR